MKAFLGLLFSFSICTCTLAVNHVRGSSTFLQEQSIEIELPYWLLPTDVGPIDIESYMGRWYEIYSSAIPMSTFEKDGYCVTADYTLKQQDEEDPDKKSFDVLNSMRTGGPTNELEQVNGVATNKIFDRQTPIDGVWYLSFDIAGMKNGKGEYIIQAVGPIVDGKYAWAMVSDVLRLSVWVLARNIATFDATYGADVMEKAKSKGFGQFWNTPIKSQQPTNCAYAPAP